MSGKPDNATSSTDAPKRVGQIQTDTFCEGCGYNLYTQAVTCDERLGLLVCRCPECGKYAVPGKATDAGRPWLQRFGTALLIAFILFLLYMIGVGIAGMAVFHLEHLEDLSRPAKGGSLNLGGGNYSYFRGKQFDSAWQPLGLSTVVGYALGSFFALFFCHWKRPVIWLVAALPVLVGIIVHFVWRADVKDLAQTVEREGPVVSAQHVAVQAAGLVLALLIARPVTRGILRIMLSRPLLPYFSHLWIADGKTPPSAAPKPFSAGT